ncbi:MAG: methionyl-tRNA formyltransferase [Candidatus Velthaea sp.]
MKSVFFGTSAFAVPSLRELANCTQIAAVVTQPDRPAGRGHTMVPTPVKTAALELGLIVHEPERLRPFAVELAALSADVFAVASYGRILPRELLDVPASGIAFNVHPSLLPLYRGATPLQSAIRDGGTETGVTIIAMDAGMDTGDVLLQERTDIAPDETYGALHDRLAVDGARLLREAVGRYEHRTLQRTPQGALGVAAADIERTLTRPLAKDDLVIDWTQKPERIVNLVRSLAPAPSARGSLDGSRVKILSARAGSADEHGITRDDGYAVPAGSGSVVLLRVVPPNRGAMTGAAYARAKLAV